jgi:hypothetical protein
LLPKLSTFLGHVDLAATQHYLVSGRKRMISSGGMGLMDSVLDSLPRVIIQTPFQQ